MNQVGEQDSSDGQLFVVSAPSGVGKTTILEAAFRQLPDLKFSVSCTTRSPRPGEMDGRDYHFLTSQEFLAGIEAGRFLEWARVHGQLYGTDGNQVRAWLREGFDVVLDIDVQGARQVRCSYPRVRTLFILPPSLEILQQRLTGRGTESPEQVAARLAAARGEILEAPTYGYIIINDQLEEAVTDLVAVIRADRCSLARQANRLRPFFHQQIDP